MIILQISYNWLKKYLELNFTPQDLAEKMTMAGLEVEGVEYLGEGLEDIIIAKIERIDPHPDADKLVICQVRTSAEQDLFPVVTGAPNVKAGQMVPLAKVGASLPGGIQIEEVKLRGELSQGMLCSADELGLQEDRAAGIMILSEDAPLGGSFLRYKNLDDYIFKLDLTPNYARCLGMIGVARELKSLYAPEKELVKPEISFTESNSEEEISKQVKITIQDPDLCPRYTARLVKNLEIKDSPDWLQRRLRAAGIRPINNVVDISNFVLMEYNQPLHTFDFDKIESGQVIVRRADQAEKMQTLDDQERQLTDDMLVIADPEKAIAVAGVMGGLNSEVTAETTNVLIESAYFNPISIRKTAKKLGMHSDASHRFERGIDIEKVIEANNRACQLLEKYAGGEVVPGVIDQYPIHFEAPVIELRTARVNQLLGIELKSEEIAAGLTRLGFTVETKENDFLVTVPSYRTDVSQAADLVEEVARIYGYNKIPSTRPVAAQRGSRSPQQKFELRVKQLLQSAGLDQVITYSLQDKKDYQKLALLQNQEYKDFVSIKNPLSEAFAILRTTLFPGLLNVLSSNSRRQIEEMAIFETGTVFLNQGQNKRPVELHKLGAAVFGNKHNYWQQGAPNFYKLKGILEMLFNRTALKEVEFIPAADEEQKFMHPGRKAEIKSGTTTLGYLGEIHPELAAENDLPAGTAVFEIDLDLLFKLTKAEKYHYQKLVKYPVLARDLAIVIAADLPIGKIYQAIKSQGGKMLKNLQLFDIYQGDQIKSGYKSAAFELKFQAEDRTLTDQEVNQRFNKIVEHLAAEYSAEIRGN